MPLNLSFSEFKFSFKQEKQSSPTNMFERLHFFIQFCSQLNYIRKVKQKFNIEIHTISVPKIKKIIEIACINSLLCYYIFVSNRVDVKSSVVYIINANQPSGKAMDSESMSIGSIPIFATSFLFNLSFNYSKAKHIQSLKYLTRKDHCRTSVVVFFLLFLSDLTSAISQSYIHIQYILYIFYLILILELSSENKVFAKKLVAITSNSYRAIINLFNLFIGVANIQQHPLFILPFSPCRRPS